MSKGFDTRVHVRDAKTGQVIRSNPYRMIVDREKGMVFERAGRRYSPDGTDLGPVGEDSKAKLIGVGVGAGANEEETGDASSPSRSESFPSRKEKV